jgi:rfaE bifunctional protein kinase chain/domain
MVVDPVLSGFPRLSALVVGDICLDRWCTYDPALAEASRETGIPRTAVVGVETTPGAGGTVANNLAALGIGRIAVLGATGDDGHGYELRQALAARGISHELLLRSPAIPTFTYTKLLNAATGEEDRPRVDFISVRPAPCEVETELVQLLREHAAEFDVILVSDQAETDAGGMVTAAVRDALAGIAREHPEKIVWVDSRLRPHLFRDVIVKPNDQEAAAVCATLFGETDYARLRDHIDAPYLFVTQGGEGVVIAGPDGLDRVPTRKVAKPVDICGAGDSFSAGAAAALAITADARAAAEFGNLVASITIMKKGTGTASPEEVRRA